MNAGGLLAELIWGLHRAESVPDADTATSGLSTGNGAITLERLRIQRPDLQGVEHPVDLSTASSNYPHFAEPLMKLYTP